MKLKQEIIAAASFEEPNLISENQIKEIMRCMI